MKAEKYSIEYGMHSIIYSVVRRDRKTLEIAVEPDSSVSVAAPMTANQESIAAKVRKRASWILAQQQYFEQFNPRTPERRFISGETHLYLGRQYRLKVVRAEESSVKLLRGYIVIQSCKPESSEETKRLLQGWYKTKARAKFLERLDVCVQHFSRPSAVTPNSLVIRTMQKRWGSMSKNHRMILNLRLIQAPIYAIDYVITHELCHVIEPSHSPRYYRFLGRVMHDWEKRKEKLELFFT